MILYKPASFINNHFNIKCKSNLSFSKSESDEEQELPQPFFMAVSEALRHRETVAKSNQLYPSPHWLKGKPAPYNHGN